MEKPLSRTHPIPEGGSFAAARPAPPNPQSFGGAGGGKRNRFDLRQVELAQGVIDVVADYVAIRIKIHNQPFDDLSRLYSGAAFQLDIEAVGFRIVMQLHD